jgi:hypothetical protein
VSHFDVDLLLETLNFFSDFNPVWNVTTNLAQLYRIKFHENPFIVLERLHADTGSTWRIWVTHFWNFSLQMCENWQSCMAWSTDLINVCNFYLRHFLIRCLVGLALQQEICRWMTDKSSDSLSVFGPGGLMQGSVNFFGYYPKIYLRTTILPPRSESEEKRTNCF